MSENLVEAIQRECNRVREIIALYKSLPNGAGEFGAAWMRQLVTRSEKAIAEQDAVGCVTCLKQLREVKR